MAITDKNTIYNWFQTDDFPTEDQFRATWDSFWHKSESIPMSQITGLNQLFQQTATVAQLNDKANVDGSNIDVSAYQEKLNITNLIATAKEEVKTELLNGAPEAFDTLKEISDWISDDETAEAAILQAIQNEATARINADNQKLDKGTYTGTAQDLYNWFEGKIEAGYNSIPVVGNGASGKVLESSVVSQINGNIGIGATPTDSKVELSPLANQTALKVLNYSLTGSNIQPALDIKGTWNTSGTPTLIKANVTDTSSNANSLLMDLQAGGVSRFKVLKNGDISIVTPSTDDGQRRLIGGRQTQQAFIQLFNASSGRMDFSSWNGTGFFFNGSITLSGGNINLQSNQSLNGFSNSAYIPYDALTGNTIIRATLTDSFSSIRFQTGGSSADRMIINNMGATTLKSLFSPISGTLIHNNLLVDTTINQTGGANGITRGLYINPALTSAADWRSIEWSNNTGYGLYGAGIANNFLAGNLGIGKLLPVEKIDVDGNVKAIDFKGQAVKFNLQTSISPTPNTLVPKSDGSGLLWYDSNSILRNIGENFFSADLSSTTARNHSMNASFTIDTKGNAYSIKNLPNKNTDIVNFRKVRVQDTSGLDSVVDSKNLLTDGVTSMSDAEKDAWRIAQRKTNETYSTGSPQVDAILPSVINGNETFNQFITVVGLNLFVNSSTPSTAILEIRRVKDINGTVLATSDVYTGLNIEVSQNNPTILSTSINFSTMPKGYYKAFVTHNGLTNLTSPEFFVGDVISTVPLPSPFWTEQVNGSPTSISNTQISSNDLSPTTYKSDVVTNVSLLQNGFIAEYICEFSGSGAGGGSTGSGTFGIIGDDNVIYGIRISSLFNGARNSVFMPDSSFMNGNGTIGLTNKMYIVYKNYIITVINQSSGKVKSFIDPSFKTTNKKAYYSMTGISGNYNNSGSMTFNNIKSF